MVRRIDALCEHQKVTVDAVRFGEAPAIGVCACEIGAGKKHQRVVRGKDASLDRQILLGELCCLIVVPLLIEQRGKRDSRIDGGDILVSQHFAPQSQCFAKELLRFRVAGQRPEALPLGTDGTEGDLVLRPERATGCLQGRARNRLRLGKPPEIVEHRAEANARGKRRRRIRSEKPLLDVDRLLRLRQCLAGQSQLLVHFGHRAEKPRPYLWVAGETRIYLLRGAVEHLARADAVAACLAGIRDPEHPDHEVDDPLGKGRLLVGAVAFAGNAPRLNRHRGGDTDQHHRQPRCHRDSSAVSPHVLPKAVALARWPGEHRLVTQMPPYVGGQLGWRAVATRPVLLQRSHGDGVEVSFELASQRARIGVPVLRRVRRALPKGAQFGAWPGWLYFPELATQFLVARGPQLLGSEGQFPGE